MASTPQMSDIGMEPRGVVDANGIAALDVYG